MKIISQLKSANLLTINFACPSVIGVYLTVALLNVHFLYGWSLCYIYAFISVVNIALVCSNVYAIISGKGSL